MSKFCAMCGTELADSDRFCEKCGAEQEIRRSNKPLIWAIGVIAVVCIIVIPAVVFSGKNKGLVAVDEVEQKLNEAFLKMARDADIDLDGLTGFEIENADEETHDQIFRCSLMSYDGVIGFNAMGLVKNGQVVQIQSTFISSDDDFNEFDTYEQFIIKAMVAFPISIFKEDIDTTQEFIYFVRNMKEVSDGTFGQDDRRTVDEDIEYTYMDRSGNGMEISVFTIRYLPAFSTGYFEDDDDEVYNYDLPGNNDSTQGEINNTTSDEQSGKSDSSSSRAGEVSKISADTWYILTSNDIFRCQNAEIASAVLMSHGSVFLVTYYPVCKKCHVCGTMQMTGVSVETPVSETYYCNSCRTTTYVRFKIEY